MRENTSTAPSAALVLRIHADDGCATFSSSLGSFHFPDVSCAGVSVDFTDGASVVGWDFLDKIQVEQFFYLLDVVFSVAIAVAIYNFQGNFNHDDGLITSIEV